MTLKDIGQISSLKYYKAHWETFPSTTPLPDEDVDNLGMSTSGRCFLPIKSLENYEKYSREIVKIVSHADVFSFASYKCLQQVS